MTSAKALFGAVVGRFVFTDARVTSLSDVGPRMRLVELAGDALGATVWTPGDKIQIYLPGRGMRTYTPLSWDSERGTTRLLLFVHGHGAETPGAAWARALGPGDSVSFFGPRSSIRFPALRERVVLFGDETSIAAASALAGVRRSSAVLEVDDEAGTRRVLDAIGLADDRLDARRAADAHLPAVAACIGEALAADGSALVLTGRAQSIQLLRRHLEATDVGRDALRAGKTKAYWSVGKSGLD